MGLGLRVYGGGPPRERGWAEEVRADGKHSDAVTKNAHNTDAFFHEKVSRQAFYAANGKVLVGG